MLFFKFRKREREEGEKCAAGLIGVAVLAAQVLRVAAHHKVVVVVPGVRARTGNFRLNLFHRRRVLAIRNIPRCGHSLGV